MAVELGVEFTPHFDVCFESGFEQSLVVGVLVAFDLPAESIDDAAGVGIHHEAWLFRCVEDDVVGCFFADSVDVEQACSQLG